MNRSDRTNLSGTSCRIFSHAGYELVPSYVQGMGKQLKTSCLAGNELVPYMTKNAASGCAVME